MASLYITVKEVSFTTYRVEVDEEVDVETEDLLDFVNSDASEEYREVIEPIEFVRQQTPEEWTRTNPERNL